MLARCQARLHSSRAALISNSRLACYALGIRARIGRTENFVCHGLAIGSFASEDMETAAAVHKPGYRKVGDSTHLSRHKGGFTGRPAHWM